MQTEQQTTTTIKKSVSKKGKSLKKDETIEQSIAPVEQQTVEQKQNIVEQVNEVPVQVVETQSEVQPTDAGVLTETSFQSVFDYMNIISENLIEKSKSFKEDNMDRDTRTKFEVSFNKLNKAFSQFTRSYNEALLRQLNILEKNGSKSSVKKTITDRDKIAIHKKHSVYDFLLTFMKLPAGTKVSRAEALTAITGYVKEQKASNPEIIVGDDNRSFKIVGDLKVLFDGIEKNLIKNNALLQPMPLQIKFTQIMTYMSHCFIKETNTVV
jgi:hypothetical protein